MSDFAAGDDLVGLLVGAQNSGSVPDGRRAFHRAVTWVSAAATGTNAVAEFAAYNATRKEKLIAARYTPSSAAVTGAATNFFSLIIGKRAAGALGTLVTLITYAASATPAGDIAQWAGRDLFAADLTSTTGSDFVFANGDTLTVAVTKAGTGMTFPAGTVEFIFDPRD